MKIRTALAGLALSLLPALGFAMCPDRHEAQSCAPGTAWDAAQGACVAQINS
ncbi:hypothetical protein [Pseudodonghicola flavimaris]|uniref:Adenylosuccinate lyase n=1 Tax=Pseudodonghicola flavimaris TaxID=3050036 RepID=A0ABT7F7A8_9RHOB|nr:hypothetical protein [Pseudodonghicola flavimaris]MDK3020487.1 hypothetical protein [Pseudodonghicola flavimaris]